MTRGVLEKDFTWKFITIFLFYLSVCLSAEEIPIPQPESLGSVVDKQLKLAIQTACDQVLLSPDSGAAWGELGQLYHIHGWIEEAIKCYEQATDAQPDVFRWYYYNGLAQYKTQPDQAVSILAQAIRIAPKYAPARLYYARALRSVGLFSQAEKQLRRANQLAPKNPFSTLWLGQICLHTNRAEQAKKYLQQALSLNPGQSEAHATMAQVEMRLGNSKAANTHIKSAQKPTEYKELRDPLWWELVDVGITNRLFAQKLYLYIQSGQLERVITLLAARIPDPANWQGPEKNPEILLIYGIALVLAQKPSNSIPILEQVLSIPVNGQTDFRQLRLKSYYYLGQAHLQLGQFVKSEQAFQAAIQLDPTAAKNYAGLGDLYLKQEQLNDAITQYKRATELLPQNTEFHHRLAGVYWDQQNYSQASLEYQTIIEQKPNGQACQRLGLIHLRQKKNTAAISLLKQSLKFAPDVARTHAALGVVYSRLGQRQEAKTQFKRVLQLDPTDGYANQMLNQLSRP